MSHHLTPRSYGDAICCFESVKERIVPYLSLPIICQMSDKDCPMGNGVGREEVGGVT